ncbi:MAG TPA: alpha/beta hydrolase [Myxococcota bacterium]|nr:alpha/beta hydrolase [Myxococcota bacterium]
MRVVSQGRVEHVTDGNEAATFQESRLDLDGLSIVRTHLPGGASLPPVVLVHGFAQNRYSWHLSRRSLVAWLALRGWDVHNLELSGHGRSRRGRGMVSFEDHVADVQRVAETLDSAFFVGHSLGGAACYAAAARGAPMAGIVGVAALFHFAQHNWLLKVLCSTTWALRRTFILRLGVRTRVAGVVLGRLYRITNIAGYGFPISGWWPGSMDLELLRERLDKGMDWASVQVWLDMSRWGATGRWEYEEAWSRCATPVLVLVGDEDHLMPLGDARGAYDRSASPDRTLLVFDDLSHEVHWGHLDLVLGDRAPKHVWPVLHHWMAARS